MESHLRAAFCLEHALNSQVFAASGELILWLINLTFLQYRSVRHNCGLGGLRQFGFDSALSLMALNGHGR